MSIISYRRYMQTIRSDIYINEYDLFPAETLGFSNYTATDYVLGIAMHFEHCNTLLDHQMCQISPISVFIYFYVWPYRIYLYMLKIKCNFIERVLSRRIHSERLILFFQNARGCAPRVFKVTNQQFLVYSSIHITRFHHMHGNNNLKNKVCHNYNARSHFESLYLLDLHNHII